VKEGGTYINVHTAACGPGEIVVSIAPFFFGSVERLARRAFERLGVANTREGNGVLLFVVPSRRRLVVLADEGAHARAGQEAWDRAASAVSARFARGEFDQGLSEGVRLIGAALARHFPPDPEARGRDELPNTIDFGGRSTSGPRGGGSG